MQKIDLKCPSCGATMTVNRESKELVCQYCGNKMLIETMGDVVEKEKNIAYARVEGAKLAEEVAKKREVKNKIKIGLIAIICLVIIVSISSIISTYSKIYMEDPFQYVALEFLGTDGSGVAQLSVIGNEIDKNDIKYTISKAKGLSENEKIKVEAISETYRFKNSTKEYVVQGLFKYITTPEQVTDKVKEYLHEKTYEYQKGKIENGYAFRGKIEKLEPYKMYITTNNKDKNMIYDVYKVTIKVESGNTYDHYVVNKYENVVVLGDSEDTVKFDSIDYSGGVISAGKPNELNAFSKEYAGNLYGFETISNFENYLTSRTSTELKIYKDI